MPKTEEEIISFFVQRAFEPGCRLIVLEKVWAREGDSKRAATTFMKHVGFLRGVFQTAYRHQDVEFTEVPPTVWQKAIGCPPMSRDEAVKAHKRKTAHKNALKAMAIERFPEVPKITLCTCDALLIGAWALESKGLGQSGRRAG